MADSGDADDRLHVAAIRQVGEAMRGWDNDSRGGSWTPEQRSASTDLPPLRFRDTGTQHSDE
jgi:hypothetical protein